MVQCGKVPLAGRTTASIAPGDWSSKPNNLLRGLREQITPAYGFVPADAAAWTVLATAANGSDRPYPYLLARRYGKGMIILGGDDIRLAPVKMLENFVRLRDAAASGGSRSSGCAGPRRVDFATRSLGEAAEVRRKVRSKSQMNACERLPERQILMNRTPIYLALLSALLVGAVRAEDARKATFWPDNAPLGKRNLVFALDSGALVRVDVLSPRLFRIRHSKTKQWTESGLNRYGILNSVFPEVAFEQKEAGGVSSIVTQQAKLTVSRKDGSLALAAADGKAIAEQAAPVYQANAGYEVRFALAKEERIYGLGDVSRENIMRRGGVYEIWVKNVNSYIPIPVVLSNRGWGLLMNTTWRNTIDVGKSDPERMICKAPRSDLDYYLFCGPDYRSLLDSYTSLTGRPSLLPIWGYGLTYVCNQNIDAFNLINEAVTFRREQMPCDVIGLEPGWMSKNYDGSTAKAWHPQRFPIPYWAPKGPHTFFGALERKGFKLSLWLCCDYDLGVYEELQLAAAKAAPASGTKTAAGATVNVQEGFIDERLSKPAGAQRAEGNAQAGSRRRAWSPGSST